MCQLQPWKLWWITVTLNICLKIFLYIHPSLGFCSSTTTNCLSVCAAYEVQISGSESSTLSNCREEHEHKILSWCKGIHSLERQNCAQCCFSMYSGLISKSRFVPKQWCNKQIHLLSDIRHHTGESFYLEATQSEFLALTFSEAFCWLENCGVFFLDFKSAFEARREYDAVNLLGTYSNDRQ